MEMGRPWPRFTVDHEIMIMSALIGRNLGQILVGICLACTIYHTRSPKCLWHLEGALCY